MNQRNNKAIIRRVAKYLFAHKFLFAITLFFACLMTIASILVPTVIQRVLDLIFQSNDSSSGLLINGVGVIAMIFLAKEILNCLRIRFNNQLEQKVILKLREDLHQKLLHLPISFYDKRKSGEISSRVIEDVQNVERAILDGTEQGVIALLSLIGVTFMMFGQEPRLAALVFLPLPLLMVMAFRYAKISKRNWKEVREASGELNALLVEDIQGNRLIHSFSLAEREKKRFGKAGKLLQEKSLKAMYRWSIQGPSASFTSSLGLLAVVGMGAHLLKTDPEFTTGKFFAFLLYANMFYEPVRQLVSINNLIAAGKASGERVFEILDMPVNIRECSNPAPFPQSKHSISFRDVSFSYDQERCSIVDKLSFDITHGSTTALVGPTGAGKSTIANLVLRYYDVSSGCVSIDEIDVRKFKLSELREKVGLVSQDPFLFDASIRDNLLLANQESNEEQIAGALEQAKVLDFVKSLPNGLDTLVGERGIQLSMGEKQRLTLARAILKDAPIMILDEATSSVDVETEREIQLALSNYVCRNTTLIIAHRLSTIRDADHIIFLDKGRILEQGTHDSLVKDSGKYANFCNFQGNLILD